MSFEILIIFVSVILLMYFAYKGVSILILAPALACTTVLLSLDGHMLASYTEIFMKTFGEFAMTYFPLFMLSALFGKIMDVTGSSKIIAQLVTNSLGKQHAILSVVLSCAIMTYGGISLFVVVFAVYPIASELFRTADFPKRYIPASIALGAFTFTMAALPGSPAIQNLIPAPYFGTDAFAAPGLGILASGLMLLFGYVYLSRGVAKAKARGEKYASKNTSKEISTLEAKVQYKASHVAIALTPMIVVLLINFICSKFIYPNIDASFLSEQKYGSTTLKSVVGNWSVLTALFFAIIMSVVFNYKRFGTLKNFVTVINNGVESSMAPIFNTASVVGYGAVINSLAAFTIIKNFIVGINTGIPTISISLATAVLSGITGSASGGMTIALETLGPMYVQIANANNINLELIHRVVTLGSAALDTLPHNGAVITLLAICGLTHKEAYKEIFFTALVGPLLTAIIIITISSIFGCF